MNNEALEIHHVATLLSTPGVGRKTVQQVIKKASFHPSDLRELQELVAEIHRSNPSVRVPTIEQIEEGYRQAEKNMKDAEREGIHVLSINDSQFPDALKSISDPPLLLYVRGNTACLQPEISVAVIGTRKPTDFGRKVGERISQKFASKGLIIVSGLAIGCDTAAHIGCLQAGGRTVAVLAHGLHMIYPSENRDLAEQIVSSGGCLVSEYSLGTRPKPNFFIERDRIQSGLSAAVVVVETDVKGGTMHTVGFCIEQKKLLACIDYPKEKHSQTSQGNRKLITEGKAIPLWESEDIERFINNLCIKSSPSLSIQNYSYDPQISLEESQQISLEESQLPQQLWHVDIELSANEIRKFQDLCHASGKTAEQAIANWVREQIQEEIVKSQADKSQDEPPKQLQLLADPSNKDYKNSQRDRKTQLEVHKERDECLTAEPLAQRLKVHPSTLTKNRNKGLDHFLKWSRDKDPEGKSWHFIESKKEYVVHSIT